MNTYEETIDAIIAIRDMYNKLYQDPLFVMAYPTEWNKLTNAYNMLEQGKSYQGTIIHSLKEMSKSLEIELGKL